MPYLLRHHATPAALTKPEKNKKIVKFISPLLLPLLLLLMLTISDVYPQRWRN